MSGPRPKTSGVRAYFEHFGQQRCMPDLAQETGISIWTLYQRWKNPPRRSN